MSSVNMSNAGCPTYGICKRCFNSGPVGKVCYLCSTNRETGQTYVFCVVYTKPYGNGGATRLIDAVYLSSILGKQHEVAKADRKVWWCREPQYEPSIEILEFHVARKYNLHYIGIDRATKLANQAFVADMNELHEVFDKEQDYLYATAPIGQQECVERYPEITRK